MSAVVLRHYDPSWLRGDVVAGVTVAAYLVPQCMAYAGVAGLPPLAGLWSAVAALLAYAVLGSSRRLSVGPESTTALLTATAIGPLAASDPSRYAALAAALAVLVGLICLAAWALRLGVLADALSRPVLIGYMAGIAALMIVSQLTTVTGVPVDGSTFPRAVSSLLRQLDQLQVVPTTVAATVLVFLLAAGRRYPRAPSPLLAVVGASIAVALLPVDEGSIDLVGDVPAALPSLPGWVGPADLRLLLLPALGVAVVGYTDNILTARAFASKHGHRLGNGQELLALGAANVGAGVVGGFPVSSSGSRTAIGDAMGARSQAYSLVAVAAVLLTIGFAGGLLATFPKPALGALVIWAALRLVDVPEFRRIGSFRRSELYLALATTAGVLLLDVLPGVAVAVGLSALDLLRRTARPHDGVLGYVPGVAGMHDVDDYPEVHLVPGLLVYRYDSPLFFANADDLLTRALSAVESIEDTTGPVHWFVLNAEANVQIDITAVDALDELRRRLEERGTRLCLARVKHELFEDLERAGFVEEVGPDRIYSTLPTAVEAYATWFEARTGQRPAGLPEAPGPSPLPGPDRAQHSRRMSTTSGAAREPTSLTAQRCWHLLRHSEVGRLAVVVDGRPDIFPVNFVVDHGSLVIRTAPGTKLAAAAHGASVAFEVDGYDAAAGEAWSVVVKGQSELVKTLQQAVETVGLPLFPWHAAPKPCFVRVVPAEVTGRSFVVVEPAHWDAPDRSVDDSPSTG